MRYLLLALLSIPSLVFAQGFPSNGLAVVHQGGSHIAVVPQVGRGDFEGPNSAGWNTGYSVVTSTVERRNPFAGAWGTDDTVVETRTQVVPNDVLGQPLRGGFRVNEEPNSAGWRTGYSAVTSTYERPDLSGALLGERRTVTETTTRIVPNDVLGNPIQPLVPWGVP
jgi:hypothetical protein